MGGTEIHGEERDCQNEAGGTRHQREHSSVQRPAPAHLLDGRLQPR